ncbi:receptor like protein 21-like [Lycium ferocissimum]|uniref:receptor like protein 21-like n=1 Tax=Lycium ferocissimum TaxID=112874 RepID=UPI0028168745|nr:receptor like protein 21-like [Lycium ferocissimum]
MIKLDDADKGEIEYMRPIVGAHVTYNDSIGLVIKDHETELERIATILTAIDLSSNQFEGVIPITVKDLGSLWLINLSHNNLKGDIPMELGQLNTLEVLDLSWNHLTGKIPQELTGIKFLAKLNLSQNLLVGHIPCGPQFNTFENDSYGGNLDLCGPPLSKKCGTSDPSDVPQQLDSEDEEEYESYFASGFTLGIKAAILKSKKFYGPISASQTNFCFPKLRIFDLSHNEFSSSLSAKVFGNFRAMTRLRGANKGKLNMLEVLDLSWNWLTGKVQQELAVLNLSQNLLVGNIPRGPRFNTFENDSYGGNLD